MFQEGFGVLEDAINAIVSVLNTYFTNIGNFFNNLISSLGSWFGDMFQKLSVLNSNIGQWFENLGYNIGLWFDDLQDNIDNFEAGIGNFFVNLFEDLSNFNDSVGNWFSNIYDSVAEWFETMHTKMNSLEQKIDEKLEDVLLYLNPYSDKFFLKLAFIPSENAINSFIQNHVNAYNAKIEPLKIFKENLEQLKNLNENTQAPVFALTLPQKWGGKTVNIINLGSFDSIRLLVKNVIRVFIWLYFIFKMYKKIPQVVH